MRDYLKGKVIKVLYNLITDALCDLIISTNRLSHLRALLLTLKKKKGL